MAKIKNTIEYLEYCIIAIWQYKNSRNKISILFYRYEAKFCKPLRRFLSDYRPLTSVERVWG
jgi:hypothetical protein